MVSLENKPKPQSPKPDADVPESLSIIALLSPMGLLVIVILLASVAGLIAQAIHPH